MILKYTDRSRIETYQTCKRRRWHNYHEGGIGIAPRSKPLPLAVGGSVHVGIATLLTRGSVMWEAQLPHQQGAYTVGIDWSVDAWRDLEETAVKDALADFAQFSGALALDLSETDAMQAVGKPLEAQLLQSLGETDEKQIAAMVEAAARARSQFDRYLYDEQKALVEAMVRAYARRRLRPLLEQYEVLEVEREGQWLLSSWLSRQRAQELDVVMSASDLEPDHELWFMSRPDTLLLERDSRQLYILSLKTAASWDVRKAKDTERDMQGLSEGVEVEKRLGEWWDHAPDDISPAMLKFLTSCAAPPRIMGIRYEYLLKGERWTDKDLTSTFGVECRSQRSHLVRGYLNQGMAAGDEQWNYSWDYHKEDGQASKLYWKSWRGTPVWQHLPIKQWIDMLDAMTETTGEENRSLGFSGPAQATGFTSTHPLDDVFIPPIVVYRNDDDLRDWMEQVEAQERHVAEDVARVEAAKDDAEKRSLLNVLFPQTRKACEYPSTCPFAATATQPGPCFGSDEARRDPLALERYVRRVPHHAAELEAGKR